MRVIFAYSDADPSSDNDVTYHGTTRGVKSIRLTTETSVPPVLPSDAFYQDLINKNVSKMPLPLSIYVKYTSHITMRYTYHMYFKVLFPSNDLDSFTFFHTLTDEAGIGVSDRSYPYSIIHHHLMNSL